jgi:hypothetical protein
MTDAPDPRVVRNLKILVITLGVLIVLGLFAVVGRIIYLASRPAAPGATAVSTAAYPARQHVELPQGADVKSLSLSGNRLAIHYVAPSKSGIAVVDLETGNTLADIELRTAIGSK